MLKNPGSMPMMQNPLGIWEMDSIENRWVNIMNIQKSILVVVISLSSSAVLWCVDKVLDSREEMKCRAAHDEFVLAGRRFRNSLDAVEKIDAFREMIEHRSDSNINIKSVIREIGRPDMLTENVASYRIRVNRLIDVYMSVYLDDNGNVIMWGQDSAGECMVDGARCELDEEVRDALSRKDVSYFEAASVSIAEVANRLSNLIERKGLNIRVRYSGTNESRRVTISQSMTSIADLVDYLCIQATADAEWNSQEDGKSEILLVPLPYDQKNEEK